VELLGGWRRAVLLGLVPHGAAGAPGVLVVLGSGFPSRPAVVRGRGRRLPGTCGASPPWICGASPPGQRVC